MYGVIEFFLTIVRLEKTSGAEGRALPARPFCLHRCNRLSRRFRAGLEAKHDSGRHSQIVLSLRIGGVELAKARQ
jgi:hypothetical protein